MVETTEGLDMEAEQVTTDEYEEKIVYPRAEEGLIIFFEFM